MSAKMTHFSTPSPRPQVSALDQPPPSCGRPHNTLYTALWSGSVIAGAVDFPHLTRAPGGLICGHLKLTARGGLNTSPHYTLLHKSYKMNNNLQFMLRHHP